MLSMTHRAHGAPARVLSCAVALLISSSAVEADAADCLDYRSTMHWAGGLGTPDIEVVTDVDVALPYAYVTSNVGLHVIDVSSSATPLQVAFVPHTSMRAVEIRDGYAYVSGANFLVFDVSDPTDPAQVGGVGNGGIDIAIEGDFAFVVSHSSFVVIDISTPQAPETLTLVPVEVGCESIVAYGDALYIARGYGVAIYDVTDKEEPDFVRFLDLDYETTWIRVYDGVLYVSGEAFTSLDLTDPWDPVVMDSLGLSSIVSPFDVQGTTAFVSAVGIRNIDISDPANLVEISRYPTASGRIAASDERLFSGNGFGFHVVEINDYNVALPIGQLATDEPVYGLSGSGHLAGLATYVGGLELVDVTDPTSPQSVGSTPTNGFAWNVHLTEDLAFVADGPAGLSIYDVSQPGSPELAGALDLAWQGLDVTVRGGVAYVAGGSAGLVTVDVSDPATPQVLGAVDPPGSASRVHIWDDWAFVSSGSAGLHIIDVSEPTSPALAATVPGFVNDVAVDPPYAYVVDPTVGLEVLDISNPATPVQTGALFLPYANTTGPPRSVAVLDGYAYIAAYTTGLQVVDVADPFAPKLIGNLVLGNLAADTARDVQILGDIVLIADEEGGLKIAPLHCDDPATVASTPIVRIGALRVEPNPVTSSATLRLHLTESGPIRVDLYSVAGRHIAGLFEGTVEAGVHEVAWSPVMAATTPSGMYYARLRQGGRTIGATPLLVR